ncbi:hypothetical protein D0T53_03560 [Dysgonomonas sp. 216]|uniref:MutS-related protein n=1 Tax=Dysgonomonas sp. 216 TaxID=2302934 RepID=UPI0013D1EC14|nr:hypothetical protein [Dysgonomonas sp. 216]NDW17992.1 hypothetical protein [Dysgonomonas sp. 216]
MDLNEVKSFYNEIIKTERTKHSALNKTIFKVGTLRLVIVLACLLVCYLMWHNTPVVIGGIAASVIFFACLLVFHNKLFRRRLYSENRIKNAENELKGIDYDFSAFDGAPEKMNGEHSFSLDLDIFGNRSFFQSINRTVTSFGKDALADAILNPLENKSNILSRQEAVKELAHNPKLVMHFRTIGSMTETDTLNTKDFADAFSQPLRFLNSKFWMAMLYAIPALYIIWFILFGLNIAPGETFIFLYTLTLVVSSLPIKKSNTILNIFDKKTAVLETYMQLFSIVEKEEFKSDLLKDNQKLLGDIQKASQAIAKLKSHHNNLAMSVTFPVFLLFNPLMVWNVRYAAKVEKWMQTYKNDIKEWFDAIAHFDALVSLSVFAFNHPDYTYPTVAETFTFEGEELGHPLINRNVCVRNDVHIPAKPYFLVVTGANMAGKSTYLRTIGLNHTMACVGMPVCAKSLKFYPGKLVTNLRTADSLADNESYFFAELKRLKMIIDRLNAGEELFIILDEILKGTNSEDKQKGSLALIRQLISLKANGVIATHDLVLGNLEKEFPEYVKDYRFEADIVNDRLSFSYKIREGVAQNMNASFLMKKMGITGL